MSEIILHMWLYRHHKSALLAKKSDNIIKVSPILLPLQTLHIKSTSNCEIFAYLRIRGVGWCSANLVICCSVFSQHTTHLSVPNLTTPPTNNANYQGSKLRINMSFNYLLLYIIHSFNYLYLSATSHLLSGAPDLSRNVFSHEFMTGDEMEALFEREKFAYLEKSKYLQDQLETFKSDIEDLKRDDKISELDKIHQQQQNQGDNKYSTIQKVTSLL